MNIKRKSVLSVLILIFISVCILFTACSRIVYTDSDIFTKEEIKSAYDAFYDYFKENHHKGDGYKLKKAWYAGDEISTIESENFSYLGYDEVIVFYTNNILGRELYTLLGDTAKDENYQWTYILGRNQNGEWEYITGGYFRVQDD